jgi:hypothetical protein
MRASRNNYNVVLETGASSRYSTFLPLVRAQNASYSRGPSSATGAIASNLVLMVVVGTVVARPAALDELKDARRTFIQHQGEDR